MRSMARLRRIADAQAKRQRPTCGPLVVIWTSASGETLDATSAPVSIRLTSGGGLPAWDPDDDGGRLTVGRAEPEPKRRKGQPPEPEQGSRAWYIASCTSVPTSSTPTSRTRT